eukprot:gnl/TRDRNA2_/TRDRNA2_168931_c0_seq1.p1 gnl/TRDRNA2_/TRDRNA2_168931_c0~~gnl/TRDRNA2_/TRDRNA2_168931_c0_seq1.p1  ORF type:complete len:575 (-),score=124.63 gnl/TRDRNA2_/TRDRNA2_168931_c0_seq1:97-1623(-)
MACENAEATGLDAALISAARRKLKRFQGMTGEDTRPRTDVETRLRHAIEAGRAVLIEELCAHAEAAGVDQGVIADGKAKAEQLRVQAETALQHAFRLGNAQALDDASREIEILGAADDGAADRSKDEANRLRSVTKKELAYAHRCESGGCSAVVIEDVCRQAERIGTDDCPEVFQGRAEAAVVRLAATSDLWEAERIGKAHHIISACDSAEKAGLDEAEVKRVRNVARALHAQAGAQIEQAMQKGSARQIEEACRHADTLGVEDDLVAKAKAHLRRLKATSYDELRVSLMSRIPRRVELACKQAEAAGHPKSLISRVRAKNRLIKAFQEGEPQELEHARRCAADAGLCATPGLEDHIDVVEAEPDMGLDCTEVDSSEAAARHVGVEGMQHALRCGPTPAAVEHNCEQAREAGVGEVVIARFRAEARGLQEAAEGTMLRAASRPGNPGRIECACKNAEQLGVDPALVEEFRAKASKIRSEQERRLAEQRKAERLARDMMPEEPEEPDLD